MTDSSTVFGRYYVQNLMTNKSHSDVTIKRSAGYYELFQQGGDRKDALVAAGREWAEQQGLPEEEWDDGWKNVEFQCEFALQEYYYPESRGFFICRFIVNRKF